jgi:hypothetical protein
MQTWKLLALLALVVVLASGTAFAAPTNQTEALLQVTDYSMIPPAAYPGTSGYVKLSVANTGGSTASSINVYYTHSQSNMQLFFPAGDMSAASSSQLTIPFKIPQQVPTGVYVIYVDVYYTSASGGSKKTSISIPIIVSQYEALEVTTLGSDRSIIAPGETIQLQLAVSNTGGVVNNLVVETPQNASFSLEGTTRKSIGNIPSGSSTNVTLDLISSSTVSLGQYTIPLVFTYQDASGNTTTQTLYVGPVSILEPSTQFRLSMNPITPTEVGSKATFKLTIENTGTSPLTVIMDVNSTTAFTPLGITRLYFESIGSHQNASKNITLGISNSVTSGYYSLPLTFTLGSGKTATQTVGISVSATPNVTITATSSSGNMNIQISNTGNAPIRSVYATAEPQGFTISGQSDRFVGTLNVDDFATLSLTLGASTPAQGNSGKHSVLVTVSFKDSNNEPHVVKKSVDVEYSGSAAFQASGTRGNQGVIFGLGWIQIIGGVVIIVIAYLGYRHFRKRSVKA